MSKHRIVTYMGHGGNPLTVKVTEAVAKALQTTGKRIDRSDRRWKQRFGAPLFDPAAKPDASAAAWEGPRVRIELFVGHGMQFPPSRLEDGRCAACLDRKLPSLAWCCYCDRTGLDRLIATPKPAERPRADDGLAGGIGRVTKKAGKLKGAARPG